MKDAFRILRKSKTRINLPSPTCVTSSGAWCGNHSIYVEYARQGLTVIQIAPFTCMPEIIAQDLLPAVSKDLGIP